MDLISKKAAVTRISDLLILELKGQRIPTWNEVYNAIGDIPSVPTVPLDKLCEWMADNVYLKDATEAAWELNPDNWKKLLTKWMEEQHENN